VSIWIIIYFIILLSAFASSLYRWNVAGTADRLLIALLVVSTIQEATSVVTVMICHRSNMPSFHIYNPIQLLIVCLYFYVSSSQLWLRKTAVFAGGAGLVAGFVNTCWLQPLSYLNSNFLLYEATTIIVLCLLTCYTAAIHVEGTPFATTQFWVTLCLLIYWSLSFATHGMRSLPAYAGSPLHRATESVLLIANLLFYSGLAIIFSLYPRLRRSGE
jgi:hypothetical protein